MSQTPRLRTKATGHGSGTRKHLKLLCFLEFVKIIVNKTMQILTFDIYTLGVSRSKFEGANAQTPRKCTKATGHGSSTDRARVTGRAGRIWDFPTVTPLVFAATVSKTH